MTGLEFANRPPTRTQAEINAAVAAVPMPDGWYRSDDVAMMEGLFMGLKLGEIGAQIGWPLQQMMARFIQLRNAATGGEIQFTITAQTRLLHAVRGLANG